MFFLVKTRTRKKRVRPYIPEGERKSERMSSFCHSPTQLAFLHNEASRLGLRYPTQLLRRIIAEYAAGVYTPEAKECVAEYLLQESEMISRKAVNEKIKEKYDNEPTSDL